MIQFEVTEMFYAIYNNEYYLTTSPQGFLPVKTAVKAKTWSNKAAADAALRALPKTMRNLGYYVMLMSDQTVKEEPVSLPHLPDGAIRQEEESLLSVYPDVKDIVHSITSYVDSIANLRSLLDQCQNEVEFQNKVQEDLLHRIEFESMACGNVAHLGSMLHKCRTKRRIYKNLEQMLYELTTKRPEEIENDYVSMRAVALASRKYQLRAEEGEI